MSLLFSAKATAQKEGRSLPIVALVFLGCVLLGGCATEPVPTGSRFVVSAPVAEFYKNGPAQDMDFQAPQMSSLRTSTTGDFGPDAQLPRGTSVTMLKREIGYSRVATDGGAVGYVSNDQLQRAPAISQYSSNVTRADSSSKWKQTPSSPRRKSPSPPPQEQLDLTDVPLPPLPS